MWLQKWDMDFDRVDTSINPLVWYFAHFIWGRNEFEDFRIFFTGFSKVFLYCFFIHLFRLSWLFCYFNRFLCDLLYLFRFRFLGRRCQFRLLNLWFWLLNLRFWLFDWLNYYWLWLFYFLRGWSWSCNFLYFLLFWFNFLLFLLHWFLFYLYFWCRGWFDNWLDRLFY